jgi:hypothetical protein
MLNLSCRYVSRLPAEQFAAARSTVRDANEAIHNLDSSTPYRLAVAIDDGGVWIIATPFTAMSALLADQLHLTLREMVRSRMGENL